MKKIFLLLSIAIMAITTSCEGPPGPPGAPAQNSPIPYVFEVTTDFVAPNYETNVPIQGMLSGDVVLVYELVGTDGGDRWALLPQIYYFNDGLETAQYNFDFSKTNVRIFIDGSLGNFSQLPNYFRLGKTFRIVLVPGDDGINNKKVKADYSDYDAVIAKYNIDDSNVKRIK